jgi:hypothetical protein
MTKMNIDAEDIYARLAVTIARSRAVTRQSNHQDILNRKRPDN